jgi:lipoprotein NlpD
MRLGAAPCGTLDAESVPKSAMQFKTLALRGLIALAVAALAACSTTPLPPPRAGQPTVIPSNPVPQAKGAFIRPAAGPTLSRFDGKRNKGLDIAGSMGDAVLASADGRVVYVGGELRGYGNMVIVKHNETYLTAYAHAQNILVKEKDVVRQGQKIAEMGMSGADRVKLHFEIRKQGVAVDPEPYLNGRAMP